MTWFSGALVYTVLWWLVFFMTLPIGARSYHEAGEATEAGNVESAPMRPRLRAKVAATTVIAAALWGLAWYLIESGLISFRP